MYVLNRFQERNQDSLCEKGGVVLEGDTSPISGKLSGKKNHHEIKILVRGVGSPKILTELGYFWVKWAKKNTIKNRKKLTPLEN